MKTKIATYNDLLHRKQQLELLKELQKDLVLYDLEELKDEMQPVLKLISFIGKSTSKKQGSALLTTGSDIAVDLLVKGSGLFGGSLIKRLLLLRTLKNLSSHFVVQHSSELTNKFKSWFGLNKNEEDEGEDEEAKAETT